MVHWLCIENVFLLVQCHIQWSEPLLPATPQICFIATDMTLKIFRLISMLELGPPEKHSHSPLFRNMVPNFSCNVSMTPVFKIKWTKLLYMNKHLWVIRTRRYWIQSVCWLHALNCHLVDTEDSNHIKPNVRSDIPEQWLFQSPLSWKSYTL